MRNLKRALSLAMASVMLLGMMVVGTSAASFSDVDSSNDLEAIEVMNAVGVMQGDERGFRPNDPIARNEIAKVMALLLKLSPNDYTYAATPFTDVPEWAQPYVAACYANGITNGTSATTYSGGNNVTAVQAARMMLRALGYLKNPQDDGDDWVLATVTQASKIGLFDGVNQTNAHAALTRNQVATMALNALEATMVEDKSDKGFEVSTPEGVTVTQSYVADYREIDRKEDSEDNYCGGGIPDGVGTQQLCEFLYNGDLKKTGSTADDFGRPGSVWKYKGKDVVGSPKTPLVAYDKKPSESTIKSDLKGYDVTAVNGVYVNSGDTTPYTFAKPVDIRGITGLGNGTRLEIYAKDDVITDIVVVGTYLAQADSDYDADDDELTITSNGIALNSYTLDGEDFALENYKEDDYLLITVADGDVKTVEPATIVSGVTVSAYKVNDSVTAGGTKYSYNGIASTAGSGTEGEGFLVKSTDTGYTEYTLSKTEYDLILDSYGYVIGVKETSKGDRLSDYLFVKDAKMPTWAVEAKVVFMDGTSATITVDEVNDKEATVSASNAPDNEAVTTDGEVRKQTFYTYTVNKDGTYDLTTVKGKQGNVSEGGIDPDAKADAMITGDSGAPTQPANNKTVFVAKDKAYVGVANAPKVVTDKTDKDIDYVSWVLDAKNEYVLAVYSSKKGSSSVDASEYIYLLKTKATVGKDSDGTKYYEYDVIKDGKKTTLAASKEISDGCGVYEITSYTDGYADLKYVGKTTHNDDFLAYKLADNVDDATEITCSGDVLGVNGTYVVLKDAKIFNLVENDGDVKTASASTLNSLKPLETGEYYKVWVIETSSSDDSISTVYLVKVKP